MSKQINRRHFLTQSLLASNALRLKALATGLPASFLLGAPLQASQAAMDAKYLMMSLRQDADPLGNNGPGMYGDPSNSNDIRHEIDHASSADLGNNALGSINGEDIFANDFSNPSTISLGGQSALASKPWSKLPQAWLDNMSCLNIATGANAHPEFNAVLGFSGAVKGNDGTGSEYFPSLIAQETAASLGTLMPEPVIVGGKTYSSSGTKLGLLQPLDIKDLFAENKAYTDDLNRLRDRAIDEIYRETKINGTRAQRNFIDQYSQSRTQAKQIGESLNALITDINGDDPLNQVKMAVALFRLNLTPLVSIGLISGGDNHQDDLLERETTETINTINILSSLHQALVDANLEDRVNFANLYTFGRQHKRNNNGGRNHHRNHHSMYLYGSNVQAGIVGDLELTYKRGAVDGLQAVAFNADTGQAANADISRDESLAAAGKTIAKSVGISDERINLRISGGKVINAALS